MRLRRIDVMLATALFGCAVAMPVTAIAMGPDSNSPPPVVNPPKADNAAPAKKKAKKAAKKQQQQSQREFDEGYKVAYRLIYTDHDYAGGIAKLRSLHQDDIADVANLIGYSSRKLGRYDDSKYWYERALAADPNHARTWSYYGMWHAEQGNFLKARDYLEKVRSICGTECREYTELKGVIEGTRVY
jgi:tetratricopeptide (TPR) repeat protein